jgi:hypothetical protein
MLQEFSDEEKELLCMAVPSLGLPAMKNPTRIDLWERAFLIDWPDDVCKRGAGNLRAYLKVLGAFGPTTVEANLKLISEGART